MHGLPIWHDQLSRAQVSRDRRGGGKVRRYSKVHGASLPAEDVTVDGFRVTSLARTVLDLACSLPMERSVPIGDAALRQGLDPVELAALLARSSGRHGIGRARRAVPFLDRRSESTGESFSRVVFHQQGVPPPQPQFEVFGPTGELVGRADFGWEERRTLGEFDGRVNYGRLLNPGQRLDRAFARGARTG